MPYEHECSITVFIGCLLLLEHQASCVPSRLLSLMRNKYIINKFKYYDYD